MYIYTYIHLYIYINRAIPLYKYTYLYTYFIVSSILHPLRMHDCFAPYEILPGLYFFDTL